MSTKVLVDNIRYRFDHGESKLYLKEKYTNKLAIAHAGGMWQITPALLAFLAHPTNDTSHEIMIDMYGNPVKVDRAEFLALANATYNEVMSQWHEEYTTLQAKR